METNKGGQMDDRAAIKHPWKAVFLTGLFTGAGHLYAGARLRGIFLIAVAIILSLTAFGGMAGFLALDAQAAVTLPIVSLGLASYLGDSYCSFLRCLQSGPEIH
jgi:predicted transporter